MIETPVPQGTTSTPPPPLSQRLRRVGALLMAAAGTARITQLRQIMRRDRRKPRPS